MNRKDLLKQLSKKPNTWQVIQRSPITEKKPVKHTNKYKSMLVKARYWNAQPNLEARLIVNEPSLGETYPRAQIEIRYVENAPQIAPLNETPPVSIKHNPEITALIENLNNLITESNNMATMAESILDTLRTASSEQISQMEARIQTARQITELKTEPRFEREDWYK